MRVRISIEVDGIREALLRMPDHGKKVGKEVLGAATQEIAGLARALAPRKRGALAGSVRATRPVMTARGVISAGVVAGGKSVPTTRPALTNTAVPAPAKPNAGAVTSSALRSAGPSPNDEIIESLIDPTMTGPSAEPIIVVTIM